MSHSHRSSSEYPKSKTKESKTFGSSSEKKIKKMGDGNNTNNYKMFKFFNRKFKISELKPPPDVKDIFSKFAAGGDLMSPDQFRTFLIEHQAEKSVSLADAKRILHEFSLRRQHLTDPKHKKDKKQSKENKTAAPAHQTHEHGLTLDEFFNFLFEEEFNGPIKREVHHDMTAPLSHYFIYTGHNSYLTGNQLSSDCSDVPIIKALERGVKVIELDLWPTSSKQDVQVYHGRTLTAPVTLVKCLKSIKEHAFDKSPYPVVITFEDHLTTKLRCIVAEMVTQIFGDMLYYPKPEDPMTEFPSPEALKYRIIISTKPPKVGEGNDKDSSEESEKSDCSDKETESKTAVDIKPIQSEAPEYAELITIHAGKPQGGLKEALEVGEKVRRLSLSEQKLEKAAEDHGADIVRFTQRNILRIYPKGTRVTSSNYKPHVGWMHGAQMVAFNMQGRDKLLWLMHGMFRANGGCGYVKKPGFLMHKGPNNEVFDPRRHLMVTKTLKVKVYVGNGWHLDFSQTHFDSFSPPDFYTKVYIVGVPADCAKYKTEIKNDEWIPVWDEEFTFGMTVPELAILRIEVREYDRSDKDDFGGQTCLPVSELRTGFRSVAVYDHKGEKYTSVRLLMRFQFESNLAPA
ncbi:phosphoinositide phospholipase C 6-like [Rosa rugosa]|uniref:phosphoinositide phospholipase C 6-like n=1 Tax=Rosa rugosa TaxID=74645 RepID=UPI002B4014FC|nr:phosphoinositide phospholipase C 6-like [Rosa rugosa]